MTRQRPILDDVTDEDLLTEIQRRFGDTWCAFSSGVRSRDECPVCKNVQPLTRHHLVPVAVGAGKEKGIKSRYVKLCGSCHQRAHELWGPGDAWQGPTDRDILVRDLMIDHDRERTPK